jgi:hypothetical protein
MDTANVNERALPIGRVLGKRALLYVALLVFAFALVLLLNTSNASATTTVNADIAVNTQWTTADDYVIDGDISVQSGVWLKIDPGVYVNFTDGSSLTVDGYLWANGTSATNGAIRFSSSTGTVPGSWDGIYLNGPAGSSMRFFSISYATNAITVTDTTAAVSGTIQFVSGSAVTIVRNTGNLNIAAAGFVINDAANGLVLVTNGGNIVATVTDCVMANVDGNAIRATSSENASISVVGGLYTSPTAGMSTAVLAQAYWNASVSISGGAAIYYAQSCAAAVSSNANAVVSVNGVTLGNIIDLGTTYAAGALTTAPGGLAQVTLTNMKVQNATIGVFALAPLGGANIAVSDVTFENMTQYGIYAEAFGTVTVALSNVIMSQVDGYGVYVISYEGGATITMTDVSIIGDFASIGQGSVYCSVNTTASVTATNFQAANLFLGLSVLTANGNINLDVTNARIENCFAGIGASAPNGAITARIDPTWINHTVFGVAVSASGNVALTLVDVFINDTVYGVDAESSLGNVNFAWTNGTITSSLSGASGIYLYATEGAVTASVSNVLVDLMNDGSWWASNGDAEMDGLYVYSNHSASVTLTDFSVNYGFFGGSVFSNNGNIVFDATRLTISQPAIGVLLVAPNGGLTITVSGYSNYNDADSIVLWLNYIDNGALKGYSSGNISATISDVDINAFSGIVLVSDNGGIDLSLSGYARINTVGGLWLWNSLYGIYLSAPNGPVSAEMGTVSMELYWNYDSAIRVFANNSVDVSIQDLTVTDAMNAVVVESLIGDVNVVINGASVANNVANGIMVYAYEGSLTAEVTDVMINHTANNGIVMQAMGDLELTMTGVVVNDSSNVGVLLLSSMGNVALDLTNLQITNSGGNGMDVLAAMGTIDATIDPSWFFNNDVGLFLDAAGAVMLNVTDTTFEGNVRGVEIHSQAGGIEVNMVNVQFLNNIEIGLFAEADQDDVVVNGTMCYLSDNYWGIFLRTFVGDVYATVDNTTIEFGWYGLLVESANDAFVTLVDDQLLGQSFAGVYVTAGHDANVIYLRDNFNGSTADDGQLFLPSVVDSVYQMIDPDEYTFDSWLTVNLDWGFEFNGVVYDQVTMSKYGYIAFGEEDVNGTYANFGSGAPNMIAAFQNENWVTDEYPGIGYKKFNGSIVFHWYVWQLDSPQLKNVFQIWLFEDGNAEIRYAMLESKYAPTSPADNAYGVNFAGWDMSWDLRLWSWSVSYNDWRSVHFTMERMSRGFASYVHAEGNVTASVTHSSVTHYMTGGMLFECVDGVLTVEISDTTFDFIGGSMFGDWAAISLIVRNGPMNVEVTDLSFYFIMGLAIMMSDSPGVGGESSMAITNCVFEQVVACGVMKTVIDDSGLVGSYALNATKLVSGNDGNQAGMFSMETTVITVGATWDLMIENTFQDNNITGSVNPWLESMYGPAAPPVVIDISQFVTTMQYISNADGASSVQYDVNVIDNVLTEAPFNGYGAVAIEAETIYAASGSIETAFNLQIMGNTISDSETYFDNGVWPR